MNNGDNSDNSDKSDKSNNNETAMLSREMERNTEKCVRNSEKCRAMSNVHSVQCAMCNVQYAFKHFLFAYLCILHLIHGNVIFDILESHAFKNIAHVGSFLGLAMRMCLPLRIDAHHPHIGQKESSHF